MRSARSNTPLCCIHTQVHVATHFSLCQVTWWVSYCNSFERSWNERGCSCFDHYRQFIFELTNYYNVIKFKITTTSRCFPVRVCVSDCWISFSKAVDFMYKCTLLPSEVSFLYTFMLYFGSSHRSNSNLNVGKLVKLCNRSRFPSPLIHAASSFSLSLAGNNTFLLSHKIINSPETIGMFLSFSPQRCMVSSLLYQIKNTKCIASIHALPWINATEWNFQGDLSWEEYP